MSIDEEGKKVDPLGVGQLSGKLFHVPSFPLTYLLTLSYMIGVQGPGSASGSCRLDLKLVQG